VAPSAALEALRDYFERVAREYERRNGSADAEAEAAAAAEAGGSGGGGPGGGGGSGGGAAPPPQLIEAQIELLNMWHRSLRAQLRAFSGRFRSAACTLLASADRELFQVGAEAAHYEGPLSLILPLRAAAGASDEDGVTLELKLPDPRTYHASLGHKVQSVMRAVAIAAFGAPLPLPDDTAWAAPGASGGSGSGASAAGGSGPSGSSSNPSPPPSPMPSLGAATPVAGAPPLLDSPLVGRLVLRRLAVSLRLDEQRMAALLREALLAAPAGGGGGAGRDAGRDAGGDVLSSLVGCFGDLFSASVAPTWTAGEGEGGDGAASQKLLVSVRNNAVTRVRADVESLLLLSAVPPRTAVRLLHVLMAAGARRFRGLPAESLKTLDAFFGHTLELVSKDALDAMACLRLRAGVREGGELVVTLSGDVDGGDGDKAGGAPPAAAQPAWPVYCINDVNLLTVVEAIKMMVAAE